jgi:hypothetical protein
MLAELYNTGEAAGNGYVERGGSGNLNRGDKWIVRATSA